MKLILTRADGEVVEVRSRGASKKDLAEHLKWLKSDSLDGKPRAVIEMADESAICIASPPYLAGWLVLELEPGETV